MENLALNKPALQSSISPWSSAPDTAQDARVANNGDKDPERWFHTNHESHPWWQVDLGDLYLVRQIRVFNRIDWRSRLRRFSILRSHDGENWIACASRASDDDWNEITLGVTGDALARFVRVRMDGVGYLHFCECEVYGEVCDAETRTQLRARDDETIRKRTEAPDARRGAVCRVGGFHVFVDDDYGEAVKGSLQSGDYENLERELALQFLSPGDKVLEAGTAVGVVAMTAASVVGARNVLTFDANPRMTEDARGNFARNGMEDIAAHCGLLANRRNFRPGATAKFGVSREFWASRLVSEPAPDIVDYVETPYFCLEDEIESFGANVLICDIEGAEVELLLEAEVAPLRLIVLETHYWARGEALIDDMVRELTQRGFSIHLGASRYNVVVMRR